MITDLKVKNYRISQELLNEYYAWLPIKVGPHRVENRYFKPAQLVKAMGVREYIKQFIAFYDSKIKDNDALKKEAAIMAVARQAKCLNNFLKPKLNITKERKYL